MALVKEIKGSINAIFIFLTNRFSQSGHISAKSVQIILTLIIKYYLLAMIVFVNMIHTCMKCTSKNQIYPTNSSGMTATPKSANSSIKFSSSLCEIALQKQRLQIQVFFLKAKTQIAIPKYIRAYSSQNVESIKLILIVVPLCMVFSEPCS